MKVPNCENAIVPLEKIEAYLLNPDHSDGGAKARFFMHVGFDRQTFRSILLKHITENDFASSEITRFGIKYVVTGLTESPSGFSFNLRSIWIILKNEHSPKLVTAYPSVK